MKRITPDGKDCDCNKRKEKLNKVRFNHKPVRCFTEQQYNQWTEFINRDDKNTVTKQWQREVLIPIYSQLFARKLKPMSCCIQQFIDNINKVYQTYV